MYERVNESIVSTLTDSPLIQLNSIKSEFGVKCDLLAKCEFFNYGNCFESRFAACLLYDWEKSGKINKETTIVCEMNVAMVVAVRLHGYNCVVLIDDLSNREMINLMRAIGAKVLENVSKEQAKQMFYPNVIVAEQLFDEESVQTIIKETLDCFDYDCDVLVVQCFNKNWLHRIREFISDLCPQCEVVGFTLSEIREKESSEEWVKVDQEEAIAMTRKLIAKEGLLCGKSSGAAVVASLPIAKCLSEDQRCVVLLTEGILSFMSKLALDYGTHCEKQNQTNSWSWQLPLNNFASNMNRVAITEEIKCFEAIRLMKKHSMQQLPVLSRIDSSLQGIITSSDVMNKMIANLVGSETPSSACARRDFVKVNLQDSVGKVLFLLEGNSFVVVVDKINEESDRFIGLIRQTDALNYLCSSSFSDK
ncbi:cystathionine beta-synthase-like protein [Dinothrombium tinctorium]|uniref:Cystathionine beta-synthase-like protein n=1 Tax=Dinothrombium tinctorium TaxID=1965070 RepID=A0A3S3PQD9_9ACAR|nr:cystathionine beta-synthase-like protein [Dinothrombium tinctorium]